MTWTFTTPFQVPEGASSATVLRLPGTSVKGAVRAVHETLAGGCLRVFDADFIPSYRDHAQVRGPEWKLAVVEKATADGQPLTLLLCDEVVWTGAAQLRQACGASLATGSRVGIQDADVPLKPNSLGRKELPFSAVVSRGGDWAVLVTDSGTRQVKKGTYFLACGRVGTRTAEITEAAWRMFRTAAAGTRDMQPGTRQSARCSTGLPPTATPTSRGRLDRGAVIEPFLAGLGPGPGTERMAGALSVARWWR